MVGRAAGILLHPTSLPGPFGIGDVGPEADRFLDWARQAGQSIWQILPVGPTGPGESPYGTQSAFAGNPLLLSPELLAEDGLLERGAVAEAGESNGEADFPAARSTKQRVLRAAWDRLPERSDLFEQYQAYRQAPAQAYWLRDWALFSAIKNTHGGAPWPAWSRELADRDPAALRAAESELADEVAFHEFVQFLFARQWERLRREAAARGIAILGDVPIYVAHDSADVWANQGLFALDARGRPEQVAGVPPDYFSETGQLWGYPLYRWDRMEQDGFRWWIERLRRNRELTDLLRIDHFRGFAGYWAVPSGERTAIPGRWLPGPGRKLFDRVREAIGDLDLVAEDLGTITPDVETLREELRMPGMKVLQFAFSEDDSPHLPHNHVPESVVYTGTHDNDTILGWYDTAGEEELRRLSDYLGSDRGSVASDLIRAAYGSVAQRAIVPVQDVLELPGSARMNDPSSAAGNWRWRLFGGELTTALAERLRRLSEISGRLPTAGRRDI